MPAKQMFLMLTAMVCGLATAWAETPAGWHTYDSPEYGFMIAYPGTFALTHTLNNIAVPLRDADERLDHPGYGCQPASLSCLEYNRPTFNHSGIWEIGVTVNVLPENATETSCYQIELGDRVADMTRTTRINGTEFHYGDTSDGWTGHSVKKSEYHTFHEHVCFEIDLDVASHDLARDEDDYKPIDQRALRRVLREQERILRTFTFVGQSVF